MHLQEVEQHLIEAFNSGTLTRREYLKHASALRDLDELMQRLASTNKQGVHALHPYKPVVVRSQ